MEKKLRPRERNRKEEKSRARLEAGKRQSQNIPLNVTLISAQHGSTSLSFFFPFASPRKKPIQEQDCVVLAWPCVQRHVLLHYLEEVTEQLDLQFKCKPHPVIHGCCKVCRAYRILLPAQEKNSGAAPAPELLPGALGRVCASPCTAERSEGEQAQTRADSNPSPSWAPGSSIISIEIQSNAG